MVFVVFTAGYPLPFGVPARWTGCRTEFGYFGTGGPTLSVAVKYESPDSRALVSVLFAVHRRVVVRIDGARLGPQYCTCGDLWPCQSEADAARILD